MTVALPAPARDIEPAPVPVEGDVTASEAAAAAESEVSEPEPPEPADGVGRLLADIALAARTVAPSWPLENFVAVNPLAGFEDQPFGEALRRAGDLYGARGHLSEPELRRAHATARIHDAHLESALRRRLGPVVDGGDLVVGGARVAPLDVLLADLHVGESAPAPRRVVQTLAERCDAQHGSRIAASVDELTVRWLAAWADQGQAAWTLPGRERGLYRAWHDLVRHDRALTAAARRQLAGLPEDPADALLQLLDELGVSRHDRRELLEAHCTAMPGWTSHIRWRAEHRGDVRLVELLAIRVAYEAVLVPAVVPVDQLRELAAADVEPAPGGPTTADRAAAVLAPLGIDAGLVRVDELAAVADLLSHLPLRERPLVWLDAYEAGYRDGLLRSLANGRAHPQAARPRAQVVCCIDVRSEGLRRHLEQTGPYETLGFAGFFAVAIRYRDLAGGDAVDSCPVLVSPRNDVVELAAPGTDHLAAAHLSGQVAEESAAASVHGAKDDAAAPFAFAEASGWLLGPFAAARTLAPTRVGRLRERVARRLMPSPITRPDVLSGFTLEERVLTAEAALTMMGLTRGFARVVVLCGHDSDTSANPYEAALRCGACGGRGGGPNARVAAAILNDPLVRSELVGRGIEIPGDTWFLAAEHDTTSDTVTILDAHLLPDDHRADVVQLERDLAEASARLAAERCASLPGAPAGLAAVDARAHTGARAQDWAEVFPEWGLAGNAAFVVGSRELTAGLDLERRVFLHSYDAAVDPGGRALETILTAPLVVAQWINCQYYFSTVDPEVFGSGTKTIHNVVGRTGVFTGGGGDLRLGLPEQSVRVGDRLVHEPVRLLAVVEAPLATIADIVDRNPAVGDLLRNGWIAMAARGAGDEPWQRWTPSGWEPWFPIAGEEVAP